MAYIRPRSSEPRYFPVSPQINGNRLIRIIIPIVVAVTTVLYLALKKPQGSVISVEIEQAEAALSALREWMIWMVALSGAAIAGMATLLEKLTKRPLTDGERTIGLLTLCFFGLSILIAVFVSGFLPSVMLRMDIGNSDFFRMPLFGWMEYPYVGPSVSVVYTLFGIGSLCLSSFIALRFRNTNSPLSD